MDKQETLEEALERKYPLTNILHLQLNTAIRTGFQEGAKWQSEQDNKELSMWKIAVKKQEARCKALNNVISTLQERMYSEKEVESLLHKFMQSQKPNWHGYSTTKWFEKYKKK